MYLNFDGVVNDNIIESGMPIDAQNLIINSAAESTTQAYLWDDATATNQMTWRIEAQTPDPLDDSYSYVLEYSGDNTQHMASSIATNEIVVPRNTQYSLITTLIRSSIYSELAGRFFKTSEY